MLKVLELVICDRLGLILAFKALRMIGILTTLVVLRLLFSKPLESINNFIVAGCHGYIFKTYWSVCENCCKILDGARGHHVVVVTLRDYLLDATEIAKIILIIDLTCRRLELT